MRTERYSYARWLDGRGILYDTLADPDQLHNRYEQRDWRGLRGDLEELLQQHLAQRGDRFLPAAAYLERYGYAVDERGAIPYTN